MAVTVKGHLHRGVPEQRLQPLRGETELDPQGGGEVPQRVEVEERVALGVDQSGLLLQRVSHPLRDVGELLDLAHRVRKNEPESHETFG
jgi:hypothetical protein